MREQCLPSCLDSAGLFSSSTVQKPSGLQTSFSERQTQIPGKSQPSVRPVPTQSRWRHRHYCRGYCIHETETGQTHVNRILSSILCAVVVHVPGCIEGRSVVPVYWIIHSLEEDILHLHGTRATGVMPVRCCILHIVLVQVRVTDRGC